MKISKSAYELTKPSMDPDCELLPDICFHLDLQLFKTQPCKLGTSHQPKKCLFYHDFKKDRRRVPIVYTAEYCPNLLKLHDCDRGDSCPYSHNRVEEFYHPIKYKSKFCSHYPYSLQNCDYGEFCCFAHNEIELAIDLLHKYIRDNDFYMFHFKTVWCPFTEEHARVDCVYAHNWQDYRRRPHCYYYNPEQCPLWNSNRVINSYLEGCPNGMLCPYAHGWKEIEYHPLIFKTVQCKHDLECTKIHCAYGHKNSAKKQLPYPGFIATPKNRMTANLSQMYQSFVNNTMQLSPPLFGINIFNIVPILPNNHYNKEMAGNSFNTYQTGYYQQPTEYKWTPMHRMNINYHNTQFPPYINNYAEQPSEDRYFVVQNPLAFSEDSEEVRFKAFLRLHNLFHLYSVLKQNGISESTFQLTTDGAVDKFQICDKDKAALKLAIHQLNKSDQLAMNSIKDLCL
jgi:hypothetical protein